MEKCPYLKIAGENEIPPALCGYDGTALIKEALTVKEDFIVLRSETCPLGKKIADDNCFVTPKEKEYLEEMTQYDPSQSRLIP